MLRLSEEDAAPARLFRFLNTFSRDFIRKKPHSEGLAWPLIASELKGKGGRVNTQHFGLFVP